ASGPVLANRRPRLSIPSKAGETPACLDSQDGCVPTLRLPTRRDSLRYFDRQLQGCRRLRTRNARLAPCARAFDKRSELKLKRFLPFNIDSVTRDASPNPSIDFAALILIIEREISVLLKDANLAKPLGTDAAGRNICHATIFEMESSIGDVFAPAKDRHAYRVDAPERRAHKMQNDFQVMDH